MATGYNQAHYRNSDGASVAGDQAAVTQATSITTGVTCNAYSGVITTVSQTVAAGAEAEFQVTNSKVAATDCVVACVKDHTSQGSFMVSVSDVSDGSFKLLLTNAHATLAGNNVLVLNFRVLKCAA